MGEGVQDEKWQSVIWGGGGEGWKISIFWVTYFWMASYRPDQLCQICFWFRASLLRIIYDKNFMVSSFRDLTSARTTMILWKSLKTSSLGTNHKCLSILTWPAKSFASPAFQPIPIQWDEFLVNEALISTMGLFDPH